MRERDVLAERYRPFFETQLIFAARMAALRSLPLFEAVSLFTTFHRLVELGAIDRPPGGHQG